MAFEDLTGLNWAKSGAKKYADQIIAQLPKGMVYKGAVGYQDLLPSNASIGDCYTVKYKGTSQAGGTTAWGAEFCWGNCEGINQWIRLGADSEVEYQEKLVSGTNIKTVNGSDILGAGNVEVKTYQPFPNNQTLRGTLAEIVTEIMKFPGKAQGMAYLGGIAGDCTPWVGGNVECTVTFMTSGIAVLSASSSNVYPYHWEYNTASSDYKWKAYLSMPPDTPSDFSSSTYTLKFINGSPTWVKE